MHANELSACYNQIDPKRENNNKILKEYTNQMCIMNIIKEKKNQNKTTPIFNTITKNISIERTREQIKEMVEGSTRVNAKASIVDDEER